MAYNPNSYFNYEAGRGSIYSSPPKSKPKNANEQAAKSMGSAGIGGLGGKPTTTAAKKIQDNFRRETQKDSGSTYDEIALPTEEKVDKAIKGLGSPDKSDDDKDQSPIERIKSTLDIVSEMMGLGKPEKPKRSAYTPDRIYSTAAFRARSNDPIDITAQNRRIDDALDFGNRAPMAYLPVGGTYDEIKKQRGADERNQKKMAESINSTIEQLYAANDPARQFYQSGVPMEQRIFEPELGYDEIALPSEATIDKKIKGLGARPDVTVTELDATTPTTLTAAQRTALSDLGSLPVGDTQGPEEGLLATRMSNVVFSDPEMAFITNLEGFNAKPYELNSSNLPPNSHRSGLTVANGFDVGQHDRQVLVDMGLSDTTIDKFGDWVGLNPVNIIDPETGEAAATRERGHALMAQLYAAQEEAGNLPSFTNAELEQISKGSYKSLGEDVASRNYGEGFNELAEDVKAVLIQEAYVTGSASEAVINSARNGNNALTVLNAMPTPTASLRSRKQEVRTWLNNNSFEDDPELSSQGVQILANSIIEEKGLDTVPLEVDSLIGPNTRRTVNNILSQSGKVPPALGASGDARRKELLQEVLIESLMPPTEEE